MSDKIYICLDAHSDKDVPLYFTWKGTALGIKKEGDTEYEFVELKGKDGTPGKDGIDGITPYFRLGEVQTLAPSLDAFVELEGTKAYPVLNFGIPRGKDGVRGVDGKTPKKGVDYFTAQDINQIKLDVQTRVEKYIDENIGTITNVSSEASKISVLDKNNIFEATNVEDALVEIYNMLDSVMEESY